MRDTACAPQPPTNQPKRYQISRQGQAQNEQKCHFRAIFGLFWAKNPNFCRRNQKFCHPHTENPPRHLVHIGFWSDIGQHVQEMAIFGQK